MREEPITELAQAFARHNKELYLVGGTVRDELLGRDSHDIDCATKFHPHPGMPAKLFGYHDLVLYGRELVSRFRVRNEQLKLPSGERDEMAR